MVQWRTEEGLNTRQRHCGEQRKDQTHDNVIVSHRGGTEHTTMVQWQAEEGLNKHTTTSLWRTVQNTRQLQCDENRKDQTHNVTVAGKRQEGVINTQLHCGGREVDGQLNYTTASFLTSANITAAYKMVPYLQCTMTGPSSSDAPWRTFCRKSSRDQGEAGAKLSGHAV